MVNNAANQPNIETCLFDMADPRNAGRPPPIPSARRNLISAAASVAAARAAPIDFWDDEAPQIGPLTQPSRKIFNPVLGYEMDEQEHSEWMREEEDAKLTERASEREREARRDEMQYKTAFRTAFELGVKAGRMQRVEPVPCVACERRKERNRIAAQASRMEKRRLERSLAEVASGKSLAKRPRRSTGGIVPPPLHTFHAPVAVVAVQPEAAAAAAVENGDSDEEEEEGEEEGDSSDERGAVPPPF